MESFEVDKIRNDVNALFHTFGSSKCPDVIVCKRCSMELYKCKCPNKCHYADHKIGCECVSLYNLIYNVAKARLQATDHGFLF